VAIDWNALEPKLLAQAQRALVTYAKKHAKETFYGAVFLVEPYDGVSFQILLSTIEHLVEDGGDASSLDSKFLPGAFRDTLDIGERVEGWDDIDEEMTSAMDDDMEADRMTDAGEYVTASKFLAVACNVALRLEREGFGGLARTPDFAISVTADPAEPGELALARYAAVKKRAALAAPAGR
jgi:hypothetical protein